MLYGLHIYSDTGETKMKAYIDNEFDYCHEPEPEPEPKTEIKPNKNDEKIGKISVILIISFIVYLISGWI